jgi:hypothetical protein
MEDEVQCEFGHAGRDKGRRGMAETRNQSYGPSLLAREGNMMLLDDLDDDLNNLGDGGRENGHHLHAALQQQRPGIKRGGD